MAKIIKQKDAEKMLQETPAKNEFLIVGIGASAGGIEALKEFFLQVPADSHIAYVVILHLSPDHDSQLAHILQQTAKIPVAQVIEKVHIQPDNVYVVPPNKHLSMQDGYIVVTTNTSVEERRAPVDIFFRSLADEHGPRAVSVILSGTGANGSMGLKRIKERGGATFVQNPREAQFNEMPRNSIATNLIDQVLPVAEIPASIISFRNNIGLVEITPEVEQRPQEQQQALREIFTQLRVQTGHDFSNYKRPTLLRRIERRISIFNLPDLPAYSAFVQQHPHEAIALMKDLLISVTNFFRDKKAFEFIDHEIIPLIIKGKTSQAQLRLWVAGCATGEEAYSMAMLCAEHLMGIIDAPKLQIFATDIDEAAIAAAREGLYSINDLADVSPERLRRFFNKEGEAYRVRWEIRETILFANHNFIKDPPFSHLDLISCRNVMIYLNHIAQERAVETFHFALNPGCYLFLGTSESVDGATDLYAGYNREHHVFQSRQVSQRSYPVPESIPSFLTQRQYRTNTQEQENRTLERISFSDLHQQLLEQYAPPSLVINEEYSIVHVSERAAKYLQIAGGDLSQNFLKLIKPELRLEMRSALYQAIQRQSPVEAKGLKVNIEDKIETLNIHIRPVLRQGDNAKGFILVLFEITQEETGNQKIILSSDEPVSKQLEEELIRLKAQLRSSGEQHDFQAEELKASNEELQAMNEELRSAAEELETSKEELQSINEELRTVNQELKVKIEETNLTSNNLQNLINSTNLATIFLDRSLRVSLFTPAIKDIFNLIIGDYGRPITDITNRLTNNDLVQDAEAVLDKLMVIEKAVTTTDDRTFMMRLAPYRTMEDRINGVVITFFNISERIKQEEALRESKTLLARELADAKQLQKISSRIIEEGDVKELYEAIVASAMEIMHADFASIQVLDNNQLLLYAWSGFHPASAQHWKYIDANHSTSCGKALRKQTRVTVPDVNIWSEVSKRDLDEYQRSRIVAMQSTPLVSRSGNVVGMLSTHWKKVHEPLERELVLLEVLARQAADLIERKQANEALRKNELRLQRMVNVPFVGVLTFNYDGAMLHANDAFLQMVGYGREDFEARRFTWKDFTPEDHHEASEEVMLQLKETGIGGPYEKEYFKKDGTRVWMLFVGADLNDGTIVEYAIDISDRKHAEDELRKTDQRIRLATTAARIYSWEYDVESGIYTFSGNAAEILGVSVLPLSVEDAQRLIHPEDIDLINKQLQASVEEAKGFNIDFRSIKDDGSIVWLSVQTTMLTDAEGRANRLIGIAQDVSERKQSEDILRESEERLQKATQIETVGVIFFNDEAEIIEVNNAFLQMSGYSSEEVSRRQLKLKDITPPEWIPLMKKAMHEIMTKGIATPYEKELLRRDGSRLSA